MKDWLQKLIQLQSLEFGDQQSGAAGVDKEALRAQIPPQILGHYDRLVARGKKGIVAVRGQVCGGCHMQVPLAVVMTLRHEQDIQLCENCGRYLYLPPEAEAVAAAPALARKPGGKTRRRKKPVPAA